MHILHPPAVALAVALAVAVSACATIPPARMALPAGLADSEAIVVTGIGGATRGAFRAGPYGGSFQRTDTRLALFDPLYERRAGRTEFTIDKPWGDGAIKADCRMRERTVTLGIVSFRPKPMSFQCDIAGNGTTSPGRIELQEAAQGLGGMMLRQEREGELVLDGRALRIRSIHDLAGSPLQTGTPIGYLFEQDGTPVGAVEVNGSPVIRVDRTADAATRRSILVGALALGLFWDPANSPLGREAG